MDISYNLWMNLPCFPRLYFGRNYKFKTFLCFFEVYIVLIKINLKSDSINNLNFILWWVLLITLPRVTVLCFTFPVQIQFHLMHFENFLIFTGTPWSRKKSCKMLFTQWNRHKSVKELRLKQLWNFCNPLSVVDNA